MACSGSDDGAEAGPSPSPITSSATPTPPPTAEPYPRPERGACYRAAYDEVLSPTLAGEPVDCAKPHATQTYRVGTVDNLVGGHLVAIDSERVQDDVADRCPDLLPGFVGGTEDDLRLSMLRAVWFTPTVEESDAGADWFRCDVVAVGGTEELARVTGSLKGVLDTPEGRDQWGMCGTSSPDDDGFERVPCGGPHSWRAFTVIDLEGEQYPGAANIREAAEGPCEDAAAAEAADPLDYEYAYEGPTKAQWQLGERFIRCWAPD